MSEDKGPLFLIGVAIILGATIISISAGICYSERLKAQLVSECLKLQHAPDECQKLLNVSGK